MNYKSMVKTAVAMGKSNETMWQSVEYFNEMLERLEEKDPSEYWKIMRKQSELMFGKHYTEDFAKHDVSLMTYKDRDGKTKHGEHWSIEEVIDACEGDSFDRSITDYDKYVACNIIYTDLCNVLPDEKILEVAMTFFFKDEDWGSPTKVWDYMSAKY